MRRYIKRLKVLLLLPALLPAAAACVQPTGGSSGEGGIRIAVGPADGSESGFEAASLSDSGDVENLEYVFIGEGPEGDSFSVTTDNGTTAVDQLSAGEWNVTGQARAEDGTLVLEGETTVLVEPDEETALDLVLEPLSGPAELAATVTWNAAHTIEPSLEVTVAAQGETSTYSPNTDNGAAALVLDDIEAGTYRITVQLFDGGEAVAGAAQTVWALAETTAEVALELDALNKVGLPIDIHEAQFDIGWDAPKDSDPDGYRIYARERGAYSWSEIAWVEATHSPSFTVSADYLAAGTWELAVSSESGGSESDLHTSMSDNADPESGWYVRWDPS